MKNIHIIVIIFLFCFLFKKSKSKENFADESPTCTFEKAYWDSTHDTIGRPCEPKPNGISDCGEDFYCPDVYKRCQEKIYIGFGDKVSCNPTKENRCDNGYKCSSKSDEHPTLGVCVDENPSSNYTGYTCGNDDDCKGFENLMCNSNNVCESCPYDHTFGYASDGKPFCANNDHTANDIGDRCISDIYCQASNNLTCNSNNFCKESTN
jgi:hypothetical protein